MRTSNGPRLGIWWDARPYGLPAVQVPLRRSKEYGRGYRDSGKLHARSWSSVQEIFPHLREKQYIDIPRGRVVHRRGRFEVQMGRAQVGDEDLQHRIKEAFNLPQENTAFVHDLEYDLKPAAGRKKRRPRDGVFKPTKEANGKQL